MAEGKLTQKKPYVLAMEPGTYSWCACGLSASQPFCDGSHEGSEFSPVGVEIDRPRKVAWCGCRRAPGPFCNGAHSKL